MASHYAKTRELCFFFNLRHFFYQARYVKTYTIKKFKDYFI
jgi:hypothetical protein